MNNCESKGDNANGFCCDVFRKLQLANQEKSKQSAQIAELEKALKDSVLASTLLTNMAVENGGVNLSLEGGACHLIAESFSEQFKNSGATNYLEMTFESKDSDIGQLLVTMQRTEGKTPGQLKHETELRVIELERGVKEAFQEGCKSAGRSSSDFRWDNSNAKALLGNCTAEGKQ